MNTKLPLQQKLFNAVSKKFKNKKAEINWHSNFFNLTRSAVYDRRNGKTPISFDEGIQLMADHNLIVDLFSEHFIAENRKYLAIPSSIETSPKEYIYCLKSDITDLSRLSPCHLWCKSNDIPIFLLKHSRLLAAFKLYYWYKMVAWTHEKAIPIFDLKWMQLPEIEDLLDRSKETLYHYRTIPGTEIWTRTMFDTTIAQLEDTVQTGGITDPQLLRQLSEELFKILNLMRKMAQSANKDPDNPKANLTVYENRTYLEGSFILGESPNGFTYIDMGYPDFIRHIDQQVILHQMIRLKYMLPQLELITGKQRNLYDFFYFLEKHVHFHIEQMKLS